MIGCGATTASGAVVVGIECVSAEIRNATAYADRAPRCQEESSARQITLTQAAC